MTPTVVLLPPLGHDRSIYDPLAERLAPHIRVIGLSYPLDELDRAAPDILVHLSEQLVTKMNEYSPMWIGGISLGATLCYLLAERLAPPPRGVLLMAPGGVRASGARRDGVIATMDELGEPEFVRRHLGGDVAHAAVLCALLRAALAVDLTPHMSRLATRIDVVWGSEDRLFNAAYMERVRRVLPPHRYHVLAGVGHYAAVEAADRVAAIIEQALEEESQ